ncbi:hypothetical protein [Bacillus pseudomycoides]|uniref:hypothetical protein n=1 Tax=Bacillus pseudomycoides TaxID=64104 RepID=UPI003000CA7D
MVNIYLREVPTQKDYDKAAEIGLNKNDVYRRIRNGWKLDEAITKPLTNKKMSERKKMILLAQKNGISETTFLKRIEKGWTPYNAAITKISKYSHLKELREKNGINLNTFHKRIQNGMDPYKAATTGQSKCGRKKKNS